MFYHLFIEQLYSQCFTIYSLSSYTVNVLPFIQSICFYQPRYIFRDKKMVHALQYKYTKGLAEWSFLDPNWLVLMRNQLQ